jgi:hypothetical protein
MHTYTTPQGTAQLPNQKTSSPQPLNFNKVMVPLYSTDPLPTPENNFLHMSEPVPVQTYHMTDTKGSTLPTGIYYVSHDLIKKN